MEGGGNASPSKGGMDADIKVSAERNIDIVNERCVLETKVKVEYEESCQTQVTSVKQEEINQEEINRTTEVVDCDDGDSQNKLVFYSPGNVAVLEDEKVEVLFCKLCPYKTTIKWYLSRHIKNTHERKIKYLPCQLCDFETARKVSLLDHLSARHRADPRIQIYRCQMCSFKSKLMRTFKRHLVKHENIEFKCDLCHHKATDITALHDHTISKHINDVNFYECEYCDYVNYNRGYMRSHKNQAHNFPSAPVSRSLGYFKIVV